MLRSLRFLIISTDQSVSTIASGVLEPEGHHVTHLSDPQQAIELLAAPEPFDVILFDTSRRPPGHLYLLERLVKQAGNALMCLLSQLGTSLWKRDAERLGIQHFLHKPLVRHDLERVVNSLGHASPRAMISPGQAPRAAERPYYLEEMGNGTCFLAGCPSMRKIYNTARLLAPVEVPVLILGESGVGKDVFANLLHVHSLRSQETFLSVNCAAMPSDLLESELFGYEAGAFTGAVKQKPGKFELANKGTLLLDEIGEMSAPMQAKLLHVLQDGRFSRLGSRSTTQVNVRVVAATNINIESAMENRTFREDLYYRISAFTVTIPPLRERAEEIPFFVEEMLRRHAATLGQESVYVSPVLLTAMKEYRWPGNLRELSNFVIRMLILQDPEAALIDLTARLRQRDKAHNAPQGAVDQAGAPRPASESMRAIVREFKDKTERRLIQEALESSGWNRRHAALKLRISYRALLYKIQHYELKETVAVLGYRPEPKEPKESRDSRELKESAGPMPPPQRTTADSRPGVSYARLLPSQAAD